MLAIRALLLMLKEGLRVFNDRLKGQEQLDCKDLPVRSMRCKFSWVTDTCMSGTRYWVCLLQIGLTANSMTVRSPVLVAGKHYLAVIWSVIAAPRNWPPNVQYIADP